MDLDTAHPARCLQTLERSLELLRAARPGSTEYEVFRNAVVKGFELSLETAGKLLRKALKAYTGAPRTVDALTWRDVLRNGMRHGLVSAEEVERWFAYRDSRNDTAHDYGEELAEDALELLPSFLEDARRLEVTLRERLGGADA